MWVMCRETGRKFHKKLAIKIQGKKSDVFGLINFLSYGPDGSTCDRVRPSAKNESFYRQMATQGGMKFCSCT